MAKLGPRGTPRVGVPIVPPAAPTTAPGSHDATAPVAPLPAPVQPPLPAGKAGVWARPGGEPARSSSSSSGPPLMPDRSAAPPPPASSTGKLPAAGRPKRSTDAGISSVWYQDGEKLDGGADLDESAAEKLERARRLMIPSGDSVSDGYAPARRPMGKIAAIGAGAVLLVIVVMVAILGGNGDSKRSDASAAAGTRAPDAGVRSEPAYTLDAAPVATDAGVPLAIDAGVKAPPVDAGTKVVGPVHKKDPKVSRDPLDNVNGSGSGTDSGSSDAIPDDEAKAKAEFFAKAGEGQLRGGDAQGAASSFKKALELDPKNLGAVIGLGEVAMQQGLYDAAIKHLKKASKLARGNAHIHTLLGECYLNSGNNKAAEASFKRALQLDPDNDRARNGYNEASSRLPPTPDDPE
jgi:Tfp pilus assembly protein PilF